MPRRHIAFAQGQYYHIYNRGVDGRNIFNEDENYLYLLRLVKKYAQKLNIAIIAYCLMPNHYHFLVRQDSQASAGLFTQRVFNTYVKAFNKKYDRRGTLFESRYKAIHIDKSEYLLHVCRYIHANPVKAHLVSHLEDWLYSNFLEWIGNRSGLLVDHQFIRQQFSDRDEYKQFVLAYVDDHRVLPEKTEAYLLD